VPKTYTIPHNWHCRHYQVPLWRYLAGGGRRAVAVWHRRAGKDDVALNWACWAAHVRPAGYWHMLPKASQARKALWDAVNPRTGKKRIDEAFPKALRDTTRENEMLIKFKNGATWQLVGSDNYDNLVGSSVAGVTYSEWSLANPAAKAFLSPIIAENQGWELSIYTPRGRNHGLSTYENAKKDATAFAELLTVDMTKAISAEILAQELAKYIDEYGMYEGEAFYRQEYYCDFNAPLLGAILGRYISDADTSGRINMETIPDPDGAPVVVSSDIGRADTCSWWYWQPCYDGYRLLAYDGFTGLDAVAGCKRVEGHLHRLGLPLDRIWLPHDARAKTFAAQFSVVETFATHFGAAKVGIVPNAKIQDRINAGRAVLPRCQFHEGSCAEGLDGLRMWQFEYDQERRIFSDKPLHDWASHPADAFTYGALVLKERKAPEAPTVATDIKKDYKWPEQQTLNEMWDDHDRQLIRRERI
jgi:phage terminase large subunit